MKVLSEQEILNVAGGGLVTAAAFGAGTTILGWASIVYYKDASYQLLKWENYTLVGSLGTVVGGIAYLAGTAI